MKHIFVVDDEKNIRDLIEKYLVKDNYKVTTFSNGNNVFTEVQRLKPDLLVLDIMMPGIDGLDLCRNIRKVSNVPIIFVSAKDEEFDRILGLELGADDYLSKPFSPRELLVRIKTVLRRTDSEPEQSDQLILGDLVIDFSRRRIDCNGQEVKLTQKEYELSEYLLRNLNLPFTREQLIENIWGYDYIGDDRVIDDLVKRIRKKMKTLGTEVTIATVWGYGYKIEE